ncbi:MAG: hypothetical protein KF713_20440 [Turneriella sp.]|nr:hypothetical protein [Turneriella sp.]
MEDESGTGVTIIMDQSKKSDTLFYAMGISLVIKGALADGFTQVFVNTKPDREGNDRVLLSFRKPTPREEGQRGESNG